MFSISSNDGKGLVLLFGGETEGERILRRMIPGVGRGVFRDGVIRGVRAELCLCKGRRGVDGSQW